MDIYEENQTLLSNIENLKVKSSKRKIFRFKRVVRFLLKLLIIFVSIGTVIGIGLFIYHSLFKEDIELVYIKGYSRKDKYGLELNRNILNGIYCAGFNNDPKAKVEEWKLYNPPCPYLRPVHYPDSIKNPKCEESSVQFINYNNDGGLGLPYTYRLKDIGNQIKEWKNWEKKNLDHPLYGYKRVNDLVNDQYYPFDYGYNGTDTSKIDDDEYYRNVINSRMDEVPDPRRRRLFSFILFNSEYDLLDLYLSEYYEIFDYFVIYESNMTFTGTPKPLYFTRALLETSRYDKFKDKLIPLPMEIKVNENNGRGYAFPREHLARREVIAEGLKSVHARHGDLYMHGDLDEMVKPHVIARLKKCGGWEHLQVGIGGGPKSFKNEATETYFKNDKINVATDNNGVYNVDYERDRSLGFQCWFYEYSFNLIQDSKAGSMFHPNIAIFDARRALGQLVERSNRQNKQNKVISKRREYSDPLLDPNFDPYQGYMYTDNTNDRHTGKGFLGEYTRFATSETLEQLKQHGKPVFWNAAWHLSSFLPTVDHLFNKVSSYSHFYEYTYHRESFVKKDIIKRIKNNEYIFGRNKKYEENTPMLPSSYQNGYSYNFKPEFWEENIKNNGVGEEFQTVVRTLDREIPTQIWKNPICYSYMLDRDFGLDKKIWWQVIPKEQWKTVHFEELDPQILDQITPTNMTETFKKEMLEELRMSH